MPICKPSVNTTHQVINHPLSENYNEKFITLQKNCGKDFTLHAIVFNNNLMKRIKK
jgi:hypothetical protein